MSTPEILLRAYGLMCQARAMAATYDENRQVCRYVHSTSRGHEAIQLAAAFQLLPIDFVSPYYRDDSLLLGLGFSPYTLMLQLLAKKDDIFSGGRAYYAHPSYKGEDKPTIIHQSSATGMQAIPTTGVAQGLQMLNRMGSKRLRKGPQGEMPIALCSLGDASLTEGEVSEAFQFAVLKKLPILYLVQDNEWGISVTAAESRTMDAVEYAAGFPGLWATRVDGSDFEACHHVMQEAVGWVRSGAGPVLVQAKVPLLGHHTSGVRKEFYRSSKDLEEQAHRDPLPQLRRALLRSGITEKRLVETEEWARREVGIAFAAAQQAPEPDPHRVADHVYAPQAITEESGSRSGSGKDKILMVDAALYAVREIMEDHPEAVLFGQDVGHRLGGVFREAATLAEIFGEHRVFNTAIQEAYTIGSTVGLSAAGIEPIVEIEFGDYIYPGMNQLVTELAKSCYLSNGKFPVRALIRVPVGAYGGGGPYHSGSIESMLLAIKGIKVVYPSNSADMKGLMKAAFLDPNPVVMLEHKGLYWNKVPGTEASRATEPGRDYLLPLGKGRVVLAAEAGALEGGTTCCVITYGMGVYWAVAAAARFNGAVEVIDLRTLNPLDEDLIRESVKRHGRCLVLTEDTQRNSFAEALAGRIARDCFRELDAPVQILGALDLPAVPLNVGLEEAMLPDALKTEMKIRELLAW
jgi:2-oxoisovalerate dehydrogenase E1 component